MTQVTLLKLGADPDKKNFTGHTAVEAANSFSSFARVFDFSVSMVLDYIGLSDCIWQFIQVRIIKIPKLVRGAVVCPQLTCCIHQLFLGSIMPSQEGFASDVSKFRGFVFRVRVF